MSRPIIEIQATRVDKDEVFILIGNDAKSFGALSMPMREYTAFIQTLFVGSGKLTNAGCEIEHVEQDFDRWDEK